MQRYYRLAGVCLLLLSFVFPTSAFSNDTRAVNSDKDQLVLGLLPFVSPERLDQRFAPLANYLSHRLDFDIAIETAPSFREFVERTAEAKRYDLLLTAPHLYYRAQREGGYRVVARVSGPPMQAFIVAPKTSQITSIADLSGRRLATPDSLALASLLTRELLAATSATLAANVALVETPTHNASLFSLHHGWTDAASLMGPIFRRIAPDAKAHLRVIAKTSTTPHMPVSVASWISAERASAFASVLIEMKNTPDGKDLLQHIGWQNFVPAQPQDYDFFDNFAAAIDFK
ncbi:MAG: phosphate/phosphite/phosphonate ABC transporter substrate-binding protein [Alphaproteobacteria bacterium]|nr:phosphate/phosphite/phosphonate ABC transporter substrate-binding protein [Alphaproteobacteria bacterium]